MKTINQTGGFKGYGDNGFNNSFLKSQNPMYFPRQSFDKKGANVTKAQYTSANGRLAMYNTNGQGRDGYIHLDNGGFTALHKSVNYSKPGSMKPMNFYTKPNPVMEAKNVFYRSNGSGRDSYIE